MGPWVHWILRTGLKFVVLRTMYWIVIFVVGYYFITTFKAAKDKVLAISQFIPVVALLGARI